MSITRISDNEFSTDLERMESMEKELTSEDEANSFHYQKTLSTIPMPEIVKYLISLGKIVK